MVVNTVMKKKIKQLSLLWKLIVMHHLMRPTITKASLYALAEYNGQPMSKGINIWW